MKESWVADEVNFMFEETLPLACISVYNFISLFFLSVLG